MSSEHNEHDPDLSDVAKRLARLEAAMTTPPRVILLGEANAGKTTAANALIGGLVLPSSVLVNTRYPTRVRFGSQIQLAVVSETGTRTALDQDGNMPTATRPSLFELTLPEKVLTVAEILDTPCSTTREMIEALPIEPAALIPVWCTPAAQAWTESERNSWINLGPLAARHGVLALTGVDRLAEHELDRVVERLRHTAEGLFRYMVYVPDNTHLATKQLMSLPDLVIRLASALKRRRKLAAQRVAKRIAGDILGSAATQGLR